MADHAFESDVNSPIGKLFAAAQQLGSNIDFSKEEEAGYSLGNLHSDLWIFLRQQKVKAKMTVAFQAMTSDQRVAMQYLADALTKDKEYESAAQRMFFAFLGLDGYSSDDAKLFVKLFGKK